MVLDMQHWKPSPVFPDRYLISDEGQLYSFKRKQIMKPHITEKGYYSYCLVRGKETCHIRAHRLVAMAFIRQKPPDNYEIDHINGIKTDNRVSNLKWSLHKDNCNNPNTVKKGAIAHHKKTAMYKDGVLVKVFESQKAAAAYINANPSGVANCIRGQNSNCKGYTFKRVEAKAV